MTRSNKVTSHTFAPVVIPCCTILHNLCLDNGPIVEPDEEDVEAGGDGNDVPEPGNRDVDPGEGAGDLLAAAVSAPVDCVPVLQERDYIHH